MTRINGDEMAEELEKLKAIRGAYRGHCTKNEVVAEQIMSDPDPNLDELRNILEAYTIRLDKITLIDQKIESMIDATGIAEEIEAVLEYSDKTMAKKKKITKFLQREESPDESRVVDALPAVRRFGFGSPEGGAGGATLNPIIREGTDDYTTPYPGISSGLVKLPKMILKPFTGDPLEWTSFWESFEAAVDRNYRINNIEKMNYLKNYLKGEAERAIKGFTLSNDNYHAAVDLLKERFGQKQTLINAYMKALWNIPSATTDVRKLREFYDSMEAYIRGLESLSITSDGYGPLLLPVLLERLPEEIRRELLRRSDDMNLESMREHLRKEIETRERSVLTSEKGKINQKEKKDVFSGSTSTLGSAAELVSLGDRSKCCVYCGKEHAAERCLLVTSLDKRVEILRKQGRCFNCLLRNHMQRKCRSVDRCSRCEGKHHDSICREKRNHNANEKANVEKKDGQKNEQDEKKSTTSQMLNNASKVRHPDTIMLQTASIMVTSPCGTKKSRAIVLFDMGAQRSFVTRKFASCLGCEVIGQEKLSVSSFGNDERNIADFDTVEIGLISPSKNVNIDVLVTKTVSAEIKMNISEEWLDQEEFKNLKFADRLKEEFVNVDILIGNDHYGYLMTGNLIKKGGVMIMESIFGWLVSGPIQYAENMRNRYSCLSVGVTSIDNNTLNNSLKQLWEINEVDDRENEKDDDVMRTFNETIRFDDIEGRYCVRWLWRKPDVKLPQNLNLCKRRLNSLVKKLRREGKLEEYDDVLKEYSAKRYIEMVKSSYGHKGILHYLPHFGVMKEDSSTTKLRIVYDVSAKSSKDLPSMNEELFAGPSLLSELVMIFIKFCLYPVALVSDVEKAFLQILLDEGDRDTTRFLWLKDIHGDTADDNLQHWRFRVVLFGATPSPFLMNATLRYHLANYDGDWVAEAVSDSLYSDNLIGGVDDVNCGIHFYNRSKEIFSDAGMNLRNWSTNSTELQGVFEEDALKDEIKVLGMSWDTVNDVIKISSEGLLRFTESIHVITKRVFCAIVSKVFDPPGYLEPYTIRGKMVMQELWKLRLGWDEEVPEELKKAAEEWMKEIVDIKDHGMSRRIFSCKIKEIDLAELHVFSDSSERAYGAVTYLRITSSKGVEVKHVLAKSRIAPIKKKTIPRLELMAAVLATNMMNKVLKTLEKVIMKPKVIFWCDSEIVLHWILGRDVTDGFVRRRIDAIKSGSDQCEWRYVPSKMNPADVISRGATVKALIHKQWNKGPSWLREEETWPDMKLNEKYTKSNLINLNNSAFIQEIKTTRQNLNVTKVLPTRMSNVIDMKRYSSLNQLLRVTAMVMRFVYNCHASVKIKGQITADERTDAMKKWLRCIQDEEFESEKVALKGNKQKMPHLISQLRLYVDEFELIQCKGRLENALLPDEVNCPVLLPEKSLLTKLVILDSHQRVCHSGVRATLSDVRERFWIIRGRKAVHNVLKRCVPCLKLSGDAYEVDVVPPLPAERVSTGLPFRYTGTDFAGPLIVKSPCGRKNDTKKVYICLFTCAVIRAIHLEVVEDLTVDAFLRAFRRFISWRGIPELVISDNAQTFKAAAESLKAYSEQIMVTSEVQKFLFNNGIKWKFIVERAPWWGGGLL